MKLFVAVIMFVIVPIVFAENPVPGVTPLPQKNSNPLDSQPQDGHEKTSGVSPVQTPTGEPGSSYKTPSDNKGNPPPLREEGDRKESWVARSALGVALMSALFTLIGLIQTNKSRKITERAYLSAEQWKIEGDYLVCKVTNKGRTPATLLSGYVKFVVWANPRNTEPEACRKVISDFRVSELPAELPAQVTVPMQAGTLSDVEWKAVKDERTYTLYVDAHIEYRDVFEEPRTMRFMMEYDAKIKDFVVAAKRTATKSRKEPSQ